MVGIALLSRLLSPDSVSETQQGSPTSRLRQTYLSPAASWVRARAEGPNTPLPSGSERRSAALDSDGVQ